MNITKILISDKLIMFLEKRSLWKQYKKAKNFLLEWHFKLVDFKIREPKQAQVYYFKINNQYRAIGIITNGVFKIFNIYDHQ